MMRPSYNVLSPSNGEVILKPTQDMVIGCYYLTLMIKNNSFVSKKWFSNENQALAAFYQKKITLHTPILVRYFFKKIKIKIDKEYILFLNTELFLTEKKVLLYKIFQPGKNKKHYLITNIGVLIAHWTSQNYYEITDLFLETSPGRLIFSKNFKNLITSN
jgi:DNA-directed RNA polymerase beta' subunit